MMQIELFSEKNLPYICTPIIGKNDDEIIAELGKVVPKNPDIIEWRVDFYDEIDNVEKVLLSAEMISSNSNNILILFTIRSHKEGGEKIPLSEEGKVALLTTICKTDYIQMIDFEVSNDPDHIKHLRNVSKEQQKKLILSYHNFDFTPEKSEICKRLLMAEFYGADVAKAAVMPKNKKDVLALLELTRELNETMSIPLITMSMGGLGSVSRILGWVYGSAVTFAVGEKSSAPGQIPIEDLRKVVEITKKSMGQEIYDLV
jgi:3-dehydroquinate dehydratase-1